LAQACKTLAVVHPISRLRAVASAAAMATAAVSSTVAAAGTSISEELDGTGVAPPGNLVGIDEAACAVGQNPIQVSRKEAEFALRSASALTLLAARLFPGVSRSRRQPQHLVARPKAEARPTVEAAPLANFQDILRFTHGLVIEGAVVTKKPTKEEVFALMMVHEASPGSVVLGTDDFPGFLESLLRHTLSEGCGCGAENGALGGITAPRTLEPKPADGPIHISVVMMSGGSFPLEIDDRCITEELREAVRAAQGIAVAEQRLICRGVILCDQQKLFEQGVADGDALLLVRVLAPPPVLRIEDDSIPSGRAVAGEYKRLLESPEGRPLYCAHILGGPFYLYHQPETRRWVITDSKEWSDYEERCWAYCESDALHPGELLDVTWRVWGGMREGVQTYREAPHMRLQLPSAL